METRHPSRTLLILPLDIKAAQRVELLLKPVLPGVLAVQIGAKSLLRSGVVINFVTGHGSNPASLGK
jgi:hypothetical protein